MNEKPADNPFAAETTAPLLTHAALLDALTADVATRRAAKLAGRNLGPVTGFPSLDGTDKKVGYLGCLEPGLHTLLGSAGGGKTALALQIGMTCGTPALFVSAEIGDIEVTRRLTANRTETYLDKFKSGHLTEEDVRELASKALDSVPMLVIMDATQKRAPVEDLVAHMKVIQNAPGAANALGPGSLLIIDSLNSWGARTYPNLSEYEMLKQAFTDLESLAQGLRIPVLLIVEQTLAAMRGDTKNEGAPSSGGGLNSGAGHRRAAFAPETVFEILKGSNFDPDSDWNNCSLAIHKNRHGRTTAKPIPLQWSGRFQKYREPVL